MLLTKGLTLENKMPELLLGCGSARKKLLAPSESDTEWKDLITLDNNLNCRPDLFCDLNSVVWTALWNYSTNHTLVERCLMYEGSQRQRLRESFFDEVHAYEVLEHLGQQGDIRSFFSTFENIYRILKPNGYLFATCPSRHSPWAWGDPGHTRIISPESLTFLDQNEYKIQLGHTPMSDYRDHWKGDFKIIHIQDDRIFHRFVLQAIKPARI
jgi:predicted SAM-dependent methyltransferase